MNILDIVLILVCLFAYSSSGDKERTNQQIFSQIVSSSYLFYLSLIFSFIFVFSSDPQIQYRSLLMSVYALFWWVMIGVDSEQLTERFAKEKKEIEDNLKKNILDSVNKKESDSKKEDEQKGEK